MFTTQDYIINLPPMEMLWVDQYRPHTVDELTYHDQLTQIFKDLSSSNDFPHIILHGPDGAGKKTRALCFLHKVFGSGVHKMQSQDRSFKPQGGTTNIEYNVLNSNFHIEITPSDNENHDRHVIQNVVKTIASNANVNAKTTFKVLIINQADKLSKQAQGALRRTMEKYITSCRMILICQYVHKLIQPIRSRCLNIRVPAPTNQQIAKTLKTISEKTMMTISNSIIDKITTQCNRNIRVAIMQLQTCKYMQSQNKQALMVVPPYKKQISDIISKILKEQSPAQLRKIRDQLYDLLVNCIEPGTILKELTLGLCQQEDFKGKLSEQNIKDIIQTASQHENTLNMGSKPILHLESFCAHVMEIVIKQH